MARSLVRRLVRTVARNQVPLAFSGRSRLSLPFILKNDLEAEMKALGSVGVLFAIVDKLAPSVAGLRWHLYRKAASGLDEDRVEVVSHPALNVLRNPNNFTTQQELIEAGQQHWELTGETWLVVGRNPKVPTLPLELWNVRPDRMRPVPDARDFISGYIYTSPDGEEVPLKTTDVIFIRRPNPLDPFRGISAIGSVLAHIDGERYSAEWNRNFFINGALPGGIIEVGDKRLSEPEFDELVLRWREMHQGVSNAHRVGFLENGAKWVSTALSQKDMDFTGLSNLSGEKIREAFGFPKPMLGSVDSVNLANAKAGEYVYSRWLVVQRGDRWKAAFNSDFLPLFGDLGKGYEFDYDSPVPADREADNSERDSKVKAAVEMIALGFEPAAVLEWLDLPDLPFTTPKTPAPVPSPPPGTGAGAPPSGPGSPGAPAEPAGPAGQNAQLIEIIRMMASGRERHDGHGGHRHDDARDDGEPWRARNSATDPAAPPTPPAGISPDLHPDAGPDLAKVQASWTSALDELLARWEQLSEGWRQRIADLIEHQVNSGNVLGLSTIGLSTTDGAAALEAAMLALGDEAAAQVVDEAMSQGLEQGAIHPAALDRVRTASTAQVVADQLGRILVGSAIGEALRSWWSGATGAAVRERVVEHLGSLTDAAPRAYLGSALTQAQHDGRVNTMAGGPSAALYSDEVLDSNICKNCKAINRKWLGNSDDPLNTVMLTYPVRGYIDCLGRDRCRGQVVAVWRGGDDYSKWVELPEQRGTEEEIQKWKLPDKPGTPWPLK